MGVIHPTCQIPNLDALYERAFGDRPGTFVEVGAFDGVTYSNTWGLAKMGWRGLYIEPNREYSELCKKNHADNEKITVINSCIGMGNAVDFYPSGEYSTFSKDFIVSIPQGWGVKYHRPVRMITTTLDDILYSYFCYPLDLVSIDTEGSELDVLNGFKILDWLPKLVIVEAHEQHKNEGLKANAPAINEYFDMAHYVKIYSDNLNNIYLRGEDAH